MAPEGWITPETGGVGTPVAAGYGVVPAAAAAGTAYELRPLSLGEILDRTFAVYLSRFWLFAGISLVSASVELLLNLIRVLAEHQMRRSMDATTVAGISVFLVLGVALITFLVAASVTQAATVFALSEVYLGKTTTIGASVRATLPRWYAFLGVALWQGWSCLWLPVVLVVPGVILISLKITALMILGGLLMFLGIGGYVGGFILYLRNTLAIPAAVVEGLSVRAAMRRSKVLSVETKGRIFVVLLISGALLMVAGVIEVPLNVMIQTAHGAGREGGWYEAASLLVSFLAHAVVSPVGLIGLTLLYFDQRVRREALDLVMMMGEEVPVVAAVAPVETEIAVVERAAEEDAGHGHDAPAV